MLGCIYSVSVTAFFCVVRGFVVNLIIESHFG